MGDYGGMLSELGVFGTIIAHIPVTETVYVLVFVNLEPDKDGQGRQHNGPAGSGGTR